MSEELILHFPLVAVTGLILVLIAFILNPLIHRFGIPRAIIFVLLGFVGSELLIHYGYDTGIRAHNFHWLTEYIFVPLILLPVSFSMSFKHLMETSLSVFC